MSAMYYVGIDLGSRFHQVAVAPRGIWLRCLFVAFRTRDGVWTEPKNMGPVINSEELEFCPMVSPDGRWLSFSRCCGDSWPTTTDAEIYWMNASIIEELRDD